MIPFPSLLPAEARIAGTQSSSRHGGGGGVGDAGQPVLRTSFLAPYPVQAGPDTGTEELFSHLPNSLPPPSQTHAPASTFGKGQMNLSDTSFPGEQGLSPGTSPHLLSPTCAGALSQQLRAPAWARSRRQVGGARFHPLHPPSASSLCSCPLQLQAPWAAPSLPASCSPSVVSLL